MLSSINKSILVLFVFTVASLSTLVHAAVHHAGTTLGSFDVDAQGAATYSIPLEVPPGINGMQPSLSLNYNSQSGNGILGMGWSLGGLSAISRCAQNLAQDGKIHGVNFSNQDRFCLNGQRLVAVNGVYGADGTEYKTATATYSKIISNGVAGSGPASFKVWSKSGQVMEYGVSADSRIEAQGKSDVLTWAVNLVSNATGNKMTFSYFEDNANGFYHIDRIDYGYVSTTPSLSVRFSFETRNDIENSFILGSTITTLKRLQKINLFVNGSNIKKYQLDYLYSLSTGKSKITKYTECDAGSICKLSSSFDWLESIANKFEGTEDWTSTGTADVTVAGITDVTGDGLADLILQYDNLGIRNWAVFVSDGTKFVNKETWAATGTADVTVAGITDVTGDGLADLILQYDNLGIRNWAVFVSDGTKFVNKETWAATGTADVTVSGLTDVTGDGLADLTLQYDYLGIRNWAVFASDGTKFVNKETWTATSTVGVTVSGLTDVTGDGVADLILQYDNLGARRWAGRVSNFSVSDKLSSITNGLGEQTNITYKPLTDNSIYTKYTTSTYPIREVQAPRYVVSSSSKSNGIGGLYSHSYKYEGLRSHLKGRGSLGFAKQITTDVQTGIVKEIYYRQDFPYTGLVDSTTTKLANGTPISETTNSWKDILNGNPDAVISSTNRFSPQLISSSESSYELGGGFVAQITKSQSYDADGNVVQVIVDSNDGHTKTNNNTYYPKDEFNWFIGQLESSSVTNKTPTDLSGLTRSSRFEYDPATGLLTKEIIEPNVPNLELVKTNTYDTYGNKTSVTVSGAGILPRTTTHNYDYSGLFNPNPTVSITSSNALGHSQTKVIDARWGKVASLTGPNNLTTTWSFDTLGRKVREDRADGNWTIMDYTICETTCAYGSPLQISKTVSGSSPITIYYDMLGREVMKESTAFDGRTIYKASNYDEFGRVVSTSLPYFSAATAQWHTYQYDVLGRNTQETFPDASSTSVIYAGLTTTYINNKGQVTKKVKNTQGKLIQSIDAASNSNFYQYDALGYLTSVTDAVGNTTSMSYNKRGHKISMDDPDMGHWEYAYNVFGKLVWQKDAKGQEAIIEYDLLNRMTKRTEIEGVSEWFYDTAANGVGKLAQVVGVNGFTQTIQYDALGRAYDATTVVSGVSMTMQTAYDSLGRISSTTYPSGLSVKNIYNTLGFLSEVRNAANDSLYWQATGVDDAGRVNQHSLGNGVTTTKFFSLQTGRLEGIKSGLGVSGTEVQNLSYVFDDLGNLTSRHDGNKSLNEFFIYDVLNRLTSATLSGQPTQSFTYDSIGNITSKTGVGSYIYGAGTAGPHAVTTAGGTTYAYDANGNQINGDGRTLTYTSFNKIKTMTKGVVSSSFDYDVNHNRIQQTNSNNNLLTITRYLGKLYEVVNKSDGVIENKHYINTAGAMVLVTERSNAVNDTRYLLKDHLGSTDVITDETGAVVESTSFDAFGARRDALSWAVASAAINSLTTRGFTGHEMHDDFGLVNMNARMYDPKLGRFLQPDVFVQFPQSTQGFNRYTYVNNNPLSYTDPTGHFLKGFFRAVTKVAVRTLKSVNEVFSRAVNLVDKAVTKVKNSVKQALLKNEALRNVASVAASYFGGPAGGAAFSAYMADITGGNPFEAFAMSIAFSYVASGGEMNFKPPYAQGHNNFFTRVVNSYVTKAKQKIVGDIVEKNTNLSRNEFNGLMFAVSAVAHNSRGSSRLNSIEPEDGYASNNQGVSHSGSITLDVIDSVLAWQGLPTGNTFFVAKAYSRGGSHQSHSLGSMEQNNLIAAGVISPSNSQMNGVPFGTVGLAIDINMNSGDSISFSYLNALFNPSATWGSGGHSNFDSQVSGC